MNIENCQYVQKSTHERNDHAETAAIAEPKLAWSAFRRNIETGMLWHDICYV